MAFVIHKHVISKDDVRPNKAFTVRLPRGWQIVHFGYDPRHAICFWYKFEGSKEECRLPDDAMLAEYTFAVLFTGTVSETDFAHHGTMVDGELLLHLIEKL